MLHVTEEVRAALAAKQPVVALESTLIAHGLPWPENLEVGRTVEAVVRAEGATPATVAVVRGRLTVGVDDNTLERIARGGFIKAGQADLGPIVASGRDAATTVSATAFAAARAGITLFATGGIGGVHRGDAADVSSDLTTLSREPIVVVSAGAKAILDLPRTLEALETLGVLVLGYDTADLPAFYTRTSGLPLEHRVNTIEEAARVIQTRFNLGDRRGVLLANPIPEQDALNPEFIEQAITAALEQAARAGVRGKALTPYLLSAIARETGSLSLAANRALVLHNARLAARLAAALRLHEMTA
ncbi:MAG TPA: pseudouridine-5'-phosphate glycosidase [Polyangia bacterium]|jgi:pseudouridine-5'-phosphate glycosidase|nr:pseudouridine-5'-phosphate glycosidase [Polyangia bacterium]